MFNIPKKVHTRIKSALKSYQPIITSASSKDVNETDTVTIIKDFFADCLGYDKYNELTSEYEIRGTYCDIAVQINNKVRLLVEIKSPGVNLKDSQIKQAADYAANTGVEWVALTNAVEWKIFRLEYKQPIESVLVAEFNLCDIDYKKDGAIDHLYLLSKEGLEKAALDEYYDHCKATSKFLIGAVILSTPVLNAVKRELKRIHKDLKLDNNALSGIINKDILKREITESEDIKHETKKIRKASSRLLRKRPKVKDKKEDDNEKLSESSNVA